MMSPEFVAENDSSRKQLREFAARLGDTDFYRPVGEWTVAAWLCHLAFWDRVILSRLQVLQKSGVLPPPVDAPAINSINDGCHLLSHGISGRAAAKLAVESADAVDSFVARLREDVVGQLESGGMGRLLRRSLHRLHHLEKMTEALSA
jgi:hypothetical protein